MYFHFLSPFHMRFASNLQKVQTGTYFFLNFFHYGYLKKLNLMLISDLLKKFQKIPTKKKSTYAGTVLGMVPYVKEGNCNL